MSIQKNVGITPNCNLNKSGVGGGMIYLRNDLKKTVTLAHQSGGGTLTFNGQGNFQCPAGSVTVKDSSNVIRQFVLNYPYVPNPLYTSYLPVCTITNKCNSIMSFTSGGAPMYIKYFGDDYKVYRLHGDGLFYKVKVDLLVNSVMGSYWSFEAFTSDVIIVDNPITIRQYQLTFLTEGYYTFSEFANCTSPINVSDALDEQITTTAQYTIESTTSVPILQTTNEDTTTLVPWTTEWTSIDSTTIITSTLSFDTTVASLTTMATIQATTATSATSATTIAKLTRAPITTKFTATSLKKALYTTKPTTVAFTSLPSTPLGRSTVLMPISFAMIVKEFISANILLFVSYVLIKKVIALIKHNRKERASAMGK